MKTVSLLSVLVVAVCLVGCGNPELVTCQQEKQTLQTQTETLQQQLDQSNTKIAALEAKNIEDQNIAMQSITTMMTKQAEKDNQMKAEIAQKTTQVKDLTAKIAALEKQIAEHKCPVPPTPEAAEEVATE